MGLLNSQAQGLLIDMLDYALRYLLLIRNQDNEEQIETNKTEEGKEHFLIHGQCVKGPWCARLRLCRRVFSFST